MVSGSFGRRATLQLNRRAMVLAQAWIMLRFRFQHHCCEDQKFRSCFIHIRDYFLFYHIQFIHYLEEQIEFTNDHLPVFCQAFTNGSRYPFLHLGEERQCGAKFLV